jgi:hypothetical protein
VRYVREEDGGRVAWMSELVTASRMRSGGWLKQALAARGEGLAKAGKGNLTSPHLGPSDLSGVSVESLAALMFEHGCQLHDFVIYLSELATLSFVSRLLSSEFLSM